MTKNQLSSTRNSFKLPCFDLQCLDSMESLVLPKANLLSSVLYLLLHIASICHISSTNEQRACQRNCLWKMANNSFFFHNSNCVSILQVKQLSLTLKFITKCCLPQVLVYVVAHIQQSLLTLLESRHYSTRTSTSHVC